MSTLGYHHTEETKEKIRRANTGKVFTLERRRNISLGQIGKKMPREAVEKSRLANIGRKHPPRSEEWRRKQRECRVGEKCVNWKGGITPINQRIRASWRYKMWRKSVLLRDNFTCQICLTAGGELNVDHIKRFSEFPELRFELSNGRTLCVPCHRKTPNYAGRKDNSKAKDNSLHS